MKILQINTVCGITSPGRIMTDIHSLLIQQGHECFIAYGRDLPRNCDNPIKIGTKLDNYVHVALTRVFDTHGFGSKKATNDFIKDVEKIDPDIIHLHNIHGYYINIEVLFNYLKTVNKPIVWTLHDCWAFTGHCSYFDYVGCDKWMNGCYKCPQKKSYPKSFLMDNSAENYKKKRKIFIGLRNMTIVTPSNWLAGLVKKSFLKGYPVKVIYNGINLNIFKPTKSEFRKTHNLEDRFIILGVANGWEERKGLKYFLEVSESLRNDEIIILVGLSQKQMKALPKNIIGITKTNDINELAEIYSTADVYVNTTLEDNFPTTNLEALACGTPVVTFDTGGSVECIDENTGLIANKGDIKDLQIKINRIRKKGKMDYSEQCNNRVYRLYNKEHRFNEYINLYKKIVGYV